MYIAYIYIYIVPIFITARFFLTSNASFAKSSIEGWICSSSKNMFRGNVGQSVRTSYSCFFLSLPCPVLPCSSAEVTA